MEKLYTHEGGPAQSGSHQDQLRRAVTSCLLWEDSFYESGVDIAQRIHELANYCSGHFVLSLAHEVKTQHKLRHAPMWLMLSVLPRKDVTGEAKAKMVESLVTRADDLAEFVAMYWKDGKKPLPASLKRGLAAAFEKFDEYQFAKYNSPGAVRLRDVMFLVHPNPGKGRKKIYKRIANDTLKTPDTWEVSLSGGGDKTETFTRLLQEDRLGYLAALRNLRNMDGVDRTMVEKRLLSKKGRGNILPFQFISAAMAAPRYEAVIDEAMLSCLSEMDRFPGRTAILVDTSGSMHSPVSERSVIQAIDAAAGMAIMVRELCDDVRVYAWGTDCKETPARRGMALRDALHRTDVGHGTNSGHAVRHAQKDGPWDRMILVTDMQFHDKLGSDDHIKHKYVVNVRGYRNGVGYGNWNWIDGFSAQTMRYMQAIEATKYTH